VHLLRLALLLVIVAHGAVAASSADSRSTGQARALCPKGVLADESRRAPVSVVLRAAQRQLAHRRFESQGQSYDLTPNHAPIDFIERVVTLGNGAPLDETVPGLLSVHRVAASTCGERTAQASWAIHYPITVAIIAGLGGYNFFVKTRDGWRFWGDWCGATKSAQWRKKYCF
jgi:hypothetical protein